MTGSEGFAKRERLQRGTEFRRVFDCGRKLVGRSMVLYVAERLPGGPRRLGLVTSRKVGNAVARNRARRLLREAYRRQKNELPPNWELVIIARPTINARSFAELAGELRELVAAAQTTET